MKKNQSKLPSTLWYVTTKEDLNIILSKGIFNKTSKPSFLFDLNFKVCYSEFSSADYMAFDRSEHKNLEYVLIEIDTKDLVFKSQKCQTEGLVYSMCSKRLDLFFIPPSSIKGFVVKQINIDALLYANSLLIWETMNLEPIPENKSIHEPKIRSINNRILTDRRHAKDFNNRLICYIHGDFESNYFDSLLSDIDIQIA